MASIAMAALVLGSDCGDPGAPPPPARALQPGGPLVRGPFYPVYLYSGTDYSGRQLDSASVSIMPTNGVVYDPATRQFQFRELGTYTLTAVGISPAVTSTVTVTDAASIAFDMAVAGNRDIYSATIYGFALKRLTTDPADDVSPTTGQGVLVFTSYRDGNAELYSKALNSELETRLTYTPANETEPQRSPNGQRLAFVRDDGGVRRIWVSKADGSDASLLTTASPTTQEGHPRWYGSSDYLLMTSTAGGGVAIYRSSATPGATPTPFAVPATPDSVYDDPDVRGLTSANFAVGGVHWIASAPGGPRRVHMASVIYNGSGAQRDNEWVATPPTVSLGEPYILSGSSTTVFTRFMADGSTTLGWIGMTAPFPAFDAIWRPIPLPGVSPRRAVELRP
ncbi:MAG TPA: hypothetical protein VFO55_11800 [Gemmatimonadaceae bacterium]|nr:hypothetical protein [Gemmatimonadaceae bacterium]